jgi:16S rRNA (guanine527-N7)-methyltransferase
VERGRLAIENPKSKIEIDLSVGAAGLGVELSEAQVAQLARYAELLEQWNRVMNLTRVPPEEVVPLHFLDSLSVAQAVNLARPARLVDVGSGAGFPGLVLKIAFPVLDVTLLDSTRKRLAFLDAVIADLSLSEVRTLHARAEGAGRDPAHRERYDIAVARAVSRLNSLAELLLPLTRVGGCAIAMKSASADEEIREASVAIRTLGGARPRVVALTLPATDIERRLVVIEKVRPSAPAYPRDASRIKAKPLG